MLGLVEDERKEGRTTDGMEEVFLFGNFKSDYSGATVPAIVRYVVLFGMESILKP